MRLLYSAGPACDEITLKRLMVVGTELCFMDRPSVMLGKQGSAGTVGFASPMRQFDTTGEAVTIEVFQPPSGPAGKLYEPYIEADLQNNNFLQTILTGLRDSESFARNALQLEANYGDGLTGATIRKALVDAAPSLSGPLEIDVNNEFFRIGSQKQLENTLAIMAFDLSVQVTSALLTAEATGAHPIVSEPTFARLLASRAPLKSQDGVIAIAPFLGVELTSSVIPDEVLQHLTLADIARYRRSSRDAYEAWTIDLNRIAADLDNLEPTDVRDQIRRLIASEVSPKFLEYRNAMVTARDDLFGDIVKRVVMWEVPTLSVAHFIGQNMTETIVEFALVALGTAAPPVVDFIKANRRIDRNSPLSYLIGLSKVAKT